MATQCDKKNAPAKKDNQVEELQKELEATGKKSLNYSIILILLILPLLFVLLFISGSNESSHIASKDTSLQLR